MLAATTDPEMLLQEVNLDAAIALALKRIRRDEVPDLPDRIIAATASFHGVPVVSCDRRIRSSNIPTIW